MLAGRGELVRRQPAARQDRRFRKGDGAELACLGELGIDHAGVCSRSCADGELA